MLHMPTLHNLAGYLDVFLPGHEDEDVARREREMDLQDLLDGAVDVVLARRLRVEGLDRERPPGDGERRRIPIERRELQEQGWQSVQLRRLHARTFSAFMVAEVTMSLRSLRRDRTSNRSA